MGEKMAYSASEAAEAVGISERHIRNLINSGQIRTVRLGRRVLIPREALHELLAAPAK